MVVGSAPAVSPNGRWLAYTTTQSPVDVFVQAFPGPGSRTQLSAGGGIDPAWSGDGRTLYYVKRLSDAPGTMAVMAVDITATVAGLSAGAPRELFQRRTSRCADVRCFDISADGPRFLMRDDEDRKHPSVTRMDLVLNWTATLAERP